MRARLSWTHWGLASGATVWAAVAAQYESTGLLALMACLVCVGALHRRQAWGAFGLLGASTALAMAGAAGCIPSTLAYTGSALGVLTFASRVPLFWCVDAAGTVMAAGISIAIGAVATAGPLLLAERAAPVVVERGQPVVAVDHQGGAGRVTSVRIECATTRELPRADVVGIYREGDATLILDAEGGYMRHHGASATHGVYSRIGETTVRLVPATNPVMTRELDLRALEEMP